MRKRENNWLKRITAWLLVFLLVLSFGGSFYGQKTAVTKAATTAKELDPSLDSVMESVKTYILNKDTNPDYSSIWNVIGLKRSGMDVPQSYFDTFYTNLVQYCKDNNWVLTQNKYSEYSKMIVVFSAIGKDARNIEGHNFLYDLSDFTKVKKQGFNGPIWALIALNSHPAYSIPTNSDASEQTT